MIDFYFNNNTVEVPTIILSRRDLKHLGTITNVSNIKYTANLNAADELTFEVSKFSNDVKENLWDEIIDLRLVYVKDFNEYFEIKVQNIDKNYMIKTITATSLCECELSQSELNDIEINTKDDIAREDYDANFPTVFYRQLPAESDPEYLKIKNSSFMHRILDKIPAYTIGHIDDSLKNLQREFSISNTSLYDFLVGECSEQFNCLFKFDSTNRTISAYDLYTVCLNDQCNYRGDFTDVCPECGGTNLKYYGEDTTVYVSTENLTEEITFETDVDSIKNCFRLEAGDENMTAAVINSNPNGSRYIYEFSDESRRDMPSELVVKMDDYDNEYNYYQGFDEDDYYAITLDSNVITNFNNLCDKYSQSVCLDCANRGNFTNNCPECGSSRLMQNTWNKMPSDRALYGYHELIPYYYECIDFYSYLKSSMMPTPPLPVKDVHAEVVNIQNEYSGVSATRIGLSSIANTSLTTANSAVLSYTKTIVNSGFVKLSVIDDSDNTYNSSTHVWTGKIKVTSYEDNTVSEDTTVLSINFTDDLATFIEEKIQKQLLRNGGDNSIFDVLGMTYVDENIVVKEYISDASVKVYNVGDLIFDYNNISLLRCNTNNTKGTYNPSRWDEVNDNKFIRTLKLYSATRLQSFHDAFEAVIGVLIDAGQGVENAELKESFYDKYYQMMLLCEKEFNLRNTEIDSIWGKYNSEGYVQTDGMIQAINNEINIIHNALNYKEYLGEELYNIFTTYVREQTYTNSNYISDGLDNNQLFDNARQFIERAKEELHKSATYQHSLNSNLNNLMAIDEFAPLKNKFDLGNWIRVKTDESISRLRLISYSVDYNDINNLNTDFSNVTITSNGLNDIKSIISQASSMATSYGYVEKKAETGSNVKTQYIDNWVENGMNSALVRINNNNDEDIQIDSAGITARSYDDITDDYNDEQLRITHNVLAFTKDGWKTVETAVGKFTMSHHRIDSNGINTDANAMDNYIDYGLVAKGVLAGWIVGSHMENSTMISGHIQNPGNINYIDLTNSTVSGQDYFLKSGNNFKVDKNGVLYCTGADISGVINATSGSFTGTITAEVGKIGNWKLDGINETQSATLQRGSLHAHTSSSDGTLSANAGGTTGIWLLPRDQSLYPNIAGYSTNTWRLIIGSNFGVTSNGAMYARNTNVDSGKIGGWTLDSTATGTRSASLQYGALHSGGNLGTGVWFLTNDQTNSSGSSLNTNIAEYSTNTWRLMVGSKFGVTSSGNLHANEADISGKITATSGFLGEYIEINPRDYTNGIRISQDDHQMWLNRQNIGIHYRHGSSSSGYWTFMKYDGYDGFLQVDYGRKDTAGIVVSNSGSNIYGEWSTRTKIYAGSVDTSSDIRLKHDIENLDLNFCLDFIKKLNPVKFLFNGENDNKKNYGFIAQDVKRILDSNNTDSKIIKKDNTDGMYLLSYTQFIAPIVKVVQYQQQEIEYLKQQLETRKEVN